MMEPYLKSIVTRWRDKCLYDYLSTEEFLRYALLGWTRDHPYTITQHWFSNCRMFHENSCEQCEYRFECYTR